MPGYHIYNGLCYKNEPTTPPTLSRSANTHFSTPSYTIKNLLPSQRAKTTTPTPISIIAVGNRSVSLSDKLWHIRKTPFKHPYFHYSKYRETKSSAATATLLPDIAQHFKGNNTHLLNISNYDSNTTTTTNGANNHHLVPTVDYWSSAVIFITTHYWLVIIASVCLSFTGKIVTLNPN